MPETESKLPKEKQNEGKDTGRQDQQSESIEGVLRRIGFGKTQWIVLPTSSLFILMTVSEVMGIGVVVIAAKCDFQMSSTQNGIFTGVSYFGSVCATYLWGYLSDTVGRRPIILYSAMIGHVFTLVSMMISNFWIFILIRFIVGFSICGASSIAYAYLGEFMSDKHRAIAINYASISSGIACLYVPFISWIILSMDWSLYISDGFLFRPWRLLLLFYLLPGFIGALIMLGLPESPKILLSHGKTDKAYEALNWICKQNLKGTDLTKLNIHRLSPLNDDADDDDKMVNKSSHRLDKTAICSGVFRKMWHDTKPLFARPHIWNFLICCIVMCCVFMTSMGLGMWFPEIQNRLSLTTDGVEGTCEIITATFEAEKLHSNSTILLCDSTINPKMYTDFAIFGALCTSGFFFLGAIINRFHRKHILMGFLIACGLFGVLLLILHIPLAVLLSFSLLLVLSELGIALVNGIIVDLMPTHLRGQAVCFCLMTGRLGAVIATNFVALIIEKQCTITFLFFAVFSVASAGLTYFLPSKLLAKNLNTK